MSTQSKRSRLMNSIRLLFQGNQPDRALMSFDERMRGVYSLSAAQPVLEEYVSTIQIDEDNPAFIFDWQYNNMIAFVAAANRLAEDQAYPNQAPPWIRTRPGAGRGAMTFDSFVGDFIDSFQGLAGGRCGHVMPAPNNQEQFTTIVATVVALQNDSFLQDAMEAAFPVANGVVRYLAVTHYMTDRSHQPRRLNLPPNRHDGIPMRRLFS